MNTALMTAQTEVTFEEAQKNRELSSPLVAIEVKSSRSKVVLPGMERFATAVSHCKKILVGGEGIPLEEFFRSELMSLFD